MNQLASPEKEQKMINYLDRGAELLANGKLEEAKELYLEAISCITDSAEIYQKLGDSCLELEQWQDAITYYQNALNLNPHHYWLYINLGEAFVKQHQWQQAVEVYEKALKIQADYPLTYHKLGAAFLELKQWQSAVKILQQAIAIEPDFSWNYYDLGKALFNLQQYQLAVDTYQKFTSLETNFWEGYFRLGEVYEQLHNFSAAIEVYTKSIALNPDFSWHYFHLGNIYLARQEYQLAANYYQKFTSLETNFWQSYHQLGEALFGLEKWQKAAIAYQKALTLNDNFFGSYYNLGSSLYNIKQETAALGAWKRAISLNPHHTQTYIRIIDLLCQRQELQEAQKWLDLGLANCNDDLNLLSDRQNWLQQNSLRVATPEPIVHEPHSDLTSDNLDEASIAFEEGKTLAKQEKWQAAIEALQRAVKFNSHEPWIHCELGLCYFKIEQYDSAEQAFYSALQHNADSSWLYSCLGEVFWTQQKWQQAADTYSKAATLEPDNFWHYDQLGDAWCYLNQWERAAIAYQKATTFYPDCSSIYNRLGKTLVKLQQGSDAKIALKKAIALSPEKIEHHEDLIALLQLQGTNEEISQARQQKEVYQTIVQSRQAIRLDKTDFTTHKNLADALVKIKSWDEAAVVYNYALQLQPESNELYPNLAIALHKQGKWAEAIDAYHEAIKVHPQEFWLYSGLGEVLDRLGKWTEAIDAYTQAIELKNNDCWLHSSLGEILAKQDRWSEAIAAYTQAVTLNPSNSWLWTCLGNAYTKLQNWLAALNAYQKAQQLAPDSFWEYDNLGDCLFEIGKWEEAIDCYRTVLSHCKHLSWFHKLSFVAWSYHDLGDRLRQQNKWQAAEQAYRKAIELNGDLPWHYFYLGESLERQYKSVEALTAYRRAAELNRHSLWFRQDETQALAQMKGKGLVICIYTCAKYQNQQQAIRDTWLKEVIERDIAYYFVIGRPGSQSYVDGDILYVDAPDTYEHLPHKTYKFIEYIHNHTFYSHVFKVDDDCYVNIDNLLKCDFDNYDYMGNVAGHEDDLDRNWHLGKTANSNIGEYQGVHNGCWANGASGYFLNRYAMQKLLEYDNYEEIALELYEDKLVGDLLRPSGIEPHWSPQYIVGVERNDQYTDRKLGLVPWDETPYPRKTNEVVVFHSDAAPDITYKIKEYFALDDTNNRQFLRKPYWWQGYPHNNICLERIDTKEINPDIDDILCFLVVRNESLRLPYVLSYYRDRGVKWFFVVDNHSNDETSAYLEAQPDVYLWHTTRSYRDARWGVDWVELLLQNYGVNHWCVLVDADELLYYPDCETKNLPQLCRELEREQKQALSTVLLDMYSQQPLKDAHYSSGQNFLEVCSYFDRNFFSLKEQKAGPFKNQIGYWGGLRQRIFKNLENSDGTRLYCLNKVPLLKYDYSIKLKEGFHWIGNAEISTQTGCLLHFKYFSTFHDHAKKEVERGQHWNGASEYASYARQLDENPDLSFYDSQYSIKLKNSQQLLELGMINE